MNGIQVVQIAVVMIPTVTSATLGGIWAIFHLRYTRNVQASFEIFFYFFAAGLIAGIVGLAIGIIYRFWA